MISNAGIRTFGARIENGPNCALNALVYDKQTVRGDVGRMAARLILHQFVVISLIPAIVQQEIAKGRTSDVVGERGF